jgi:hypothetical protein
LLFPAGKAYVIKKLPLVRIPGLIQIKNNQAAIFVDRLNCFPNGRDHASEEGFVAKELA